MRSLCLLLVTCLAVPCPSVAFAQEPAHKLNLVIVEGEGAINNIRQRTARAPIVQVEDENHKPVAGVAVLFLLPEHGAGGTFADGSHSLSAVTDSQGRAVARGIHLNNVQGRFQIQVTANYNGMTASASISQTTGAAAAGGTAVAATGISTKLIVILAVAAGAVAGGVIAATRSGGSNSAATAAGTSITPGTGSVGPPK